MFLFEAQDETSARVFRFSKLLDSCRRGSESGRQAVVDVDDCGEFFRGRIGPGFVHSAFNEYAETEDILAQFFVHGMVWFCQFGLEYGPYSVVVFEGLFQIGPAGFRSPIFLTIL